MKDTIIMIMLLVVAVFLAVPSLVNATDIRKGAVICSSLTDLSNYETGDEEARENLLKGPCRVTEGARDVSVSMVRDNFAFISKSGDLPTAWTNQTNLLGWDNKDKYYREPNRDYKYYTDETKRTGGRSDF